MPTTPSYATAEFTWGLILAAMRAIPQADGGAEGRQNGRSAVGHTLRGKTLGNLRLRSGSAPSFAGYGKAVRHEGAGMGRARPALAKGARPDGYETASSKAAFFEQCDVISLHMRLVDATRGIVKAEDLARMKPSALLVNTSRAPLIEAERAWVNALRTGRPGMAAVDVYEEGAAARRQRSPADHGTTWVCTPHLGYVSRDEYEIQFTDIFESDRGLCCGFANERSQSGCDGQAGDDVARVMRQDTRSLELRPASWPGQAPAMTEYKSKERDRPIGPVCVDCSLPTIRDSCSRRRPVFFGRRLSLLPWHLPSPSGPCPSLPESCLRPAGGRILWLRRMPCLALPMASLVAPLILSVVEPTGTLLCKG